MSYLDIAQYYENEKGRQELVDGLWNLLQADNQVDKKPTVIHDEIVRLPVRRIFTTNFDTLLESAALRNNRTPRKITNTDPSVSMAPDQLTIFKLHGDLDQRPSYVITADDYEGYANKYRTSVLMMSYEFHTGTVLFVGYSFNDLDLRMILKEVSAQAGPLRRRHYALFTNPSPAVEKDLYRRGIQMIKIECAEADRTAEVHKWLAEFSERIKAFNRATQFSAEAAGMPTIQSAAAASFRPPTPSYRTLVGRDLDIKEVEGLLSTPGVPVVVIEGFPGSGKTSLALEVIRRNSQSRPETPAHVAERHAGRNFDHVVWMGGSDPEQRRSLDDVIAAISLTINGVRPSDKAAEEEALRLLRMHRVLLVIDNFDPDKDSQLINWFNQVPEPSRVLVTTRRQPPPELDRAVRHLTGLSDAASQEFLSAIAPGIVAKEPAAIANLITATGGNPQALLLAVGLTSSSTMTLSDVVQQLQSNTPTPQLDQELFDQLFLSSWNLLEPEARQIIVSTPVFSTLPFIRREALGAVSGIDSPTFDLALDQLIGANLLDDDKDNEGRIIVHPLMRVFARRRLDQVPSEQQSEMRVRELKHYLEFIRDHVIRKRPMELPRYWNALVSGSMTAIDPEWPAIEDVIEWAVKNQRSADVIEFVMLAVHYMDSRFLNQERLKYVHIAADALSKTERKSDEALLRIDALGWTYIEEGYPGDAKREINAGFEIALRLENADLMALAYSWLARIATEASDVAAATGLVQSALGMKTSPWIWYRVNMAAGDIAYSEDRCERALQFYQTAANQVEEYGGEEGYQIETRLGLAWAGLGYLDEAERNFTRISGLGQIAIGQLHAKYGLALVAKKRDDLTKAKQLADEVRQTLTARTKSSLLLKMIEKLL